MARLGELLVAAGLLSQEQIDQALRAQVVWGARLGTNLVELGLIKLDELSTFLARQHNLPAALARHFEKSDPDLQAQLHSDVAERFTCVPLFRVGPERKVIVAATSPLTKKQIAILAEEMALDSPAQVLPAIAAELRIRYQLERVFAVPRPARFMRTPGGGVPLVPSPNVFDEEPSDVEIPAMPTMTPSPVVAEDPPPAPVEAAPLPVDIDEELTIPVHEVETIPVIVEPDLPSEHELAAALSNLDEVAPEASQPELDEDELRRRRRYVPTLADKPSFDSQQQLARIAIRKVAVPAEPLHSVGAVPNTLGEATRAIRRAVDRDRVAELCMRTLERFTPACAAATLLVLRGHVATSWKGFGRDCDVASELSVPLDQPGLVGRAAHRNQTSRSPATDLGAIDKRLLASLGVGDGAGLDLVVVPIPVGGLVVSVLAYASATDEPAGTAETIAAAVGAAFARLMRNASR